MSDDRDVSASGAQLLEHNFLAKEEILRLAWWGRDVGDISNTGIAADRCFALGLIKLIRFLKFELYVERIIFYYLGINAKEVIHRLTTSGLTVPVTTSSRMTAIASLVAALINPSSRYFLLGKNCKFSFEIQLSLSICIILRLAIMTRAVSISH